MSFETFISTQLEERKLTQGFRQRACVTQNHEGLLSTDQGHYLDFCSNDYLGLRSNPDLLQTWVEGLSLCGGGSGASPLVSGYMAPHKALEEAIATSLNREKALLFSSGFAANQALCRALFSNGGTLICDKFMHASFIDGALASNATLKRFKHNNLEHAESLLNAHSSQVPIMVATEGVFSMDGDTPDIRALANLSQDYNAWLMIDDAHGLGVLGQQGLGCVEEFGLALSDAPVIMGTLGKALGTGGAFIAGSDELIDFLVNFARDYVYSTSMPPAQAHASLYAWQRMQKGDLTAALHQNIAYFRKQGLAKSLPLSPSTSAIQLIEIGDPDNVLTASESLKKLGIWVGAMRAPTVPKGTDRLRITLRANHSKQDIDALLDALAIVLNESVSKEA